MNRLYSVMFLIAGAVAMPAVADGHGDHRKGGERMKNAVKQMDANNDGAISFDEFRIPDGRQAPEMRMDANGDGELTRDEVSQVVTQRTEEALDTGSDLIAVACPFCNIMMSDGVKALDENKKTIVLDIAELVSKAEEF